MNIESVHDKLLSASSTFAVVGLGYVGLPLAAAFVEAGHTVLGFDLDAEKVDKLNRHECYVFHLGSAWLKANPQLFRATVSPTELTKADAIMICVPTPLQGDGQTPDLSYVVATANMIASRLRPGQLIVLESTVMPGTTRNLLGKILFEAGQSMGLTIGEDFFVGFSPEREDPGNKDYTLQEIPKIVSGLEPNATALITTLYSIICEKLVPVSSCEVAEAAKLLENTYRAVNIALVNELRMLFNEAHLDIHEVIEAAATKPFGFAPFYPGPGYGGGCIPVSPQYLNSWLADTIDAESSFISLATKMNDDVTRYILRELGKLLRQRGTTIHMAKILVLGVAYKANINDTRHSPSFPIMQRMLDSGAAVCYHDPYVPTLPKLRHYPDLQRLTSVPLIPATLAENDAVLICTPHSCYDYDFIAQHAKLVVDTRNVANVMTNAAYKVVKV